MASPFLSGPPIVTHLRVARRTVTGELVEDTELSGVRVFFRQVDDGSYTTDQKDLGKVMTSNTYVRFEATANNAQGSTCVLMVRTSLDMTTWTEWKQFNDGEQLRFQGIQFRVDFHAESFDWLPFISTFLLVIDVPDIFKSGTSPVSIGGTTVNYGYDFYIVPYVVASAVGANRKADIQSRGKSSFVVKVLDETGTDVGGTVDWHAKGY